MQDITFNGLTSTLKGNIYGNSAIRRLACAFPKSHGTVGSAPVEWLTGIPVAERADFMKELYNTFAQIAKIQRRAIFGANRKSAELLRKFFKEIGVIDPKDRLRFSDTGFGSFSDVVSFNVGNKKYAMKIFSQDELLRGVKKAFGNGAEQNNALYINAGENSDWVKFYFGNVFDEYMITKYVDNNTPLPKKKIKLSDIGLEFIDYDMKNIKNNINIDYGGHEVLEDFPAGNKVAMWTIKKLKNLSPEMRAEEIEKITANKKVPNYYDRMVGVKYIQTHVIPKEVDISLRKHGFWNSLLNAFMGMYSD